MALESVEAAALGRSGSAPRPAAPVPRAGGIAFRRLPLVAIGFLALLGGIWAGLIRAGWPWPAPSASMAALHGPLIVCGFLGTLIGVERAVALGQRWAFAAPVLAAIGGLALLPGVPLPVALPLSGGHAPPAGAVVLVAASVAFLAVNVAIVRRQPAVFTFVMAAGAACWLIGNASWVHGLPLPLVVLWWAAFLVLTIAGERLELSRLTGPGNRGSHRFLAAAGLLVAGAAVATVAGVLGSASGLLTPDAGYRLAGAGLIGLVLWLARHDAALRTVRMPGLPRFVAVNILVGYGWLLAGGCLALAGGYLRPAFAYDAFLHLVFLGFVFGMIFGHAPIILPAVLRVPLAFRPRFWAHFALLEVSLLLRVSADAAGWFDGRRLGALLNGAAIVLFLASTALAIGQAVRERARAARTDAA